MIQNNVVMVGLIISMHFQQFEELKFLIFSKQIRHCNRSCEIVGGSHVLNKVSRCFPRQCSVFFVKAVYCHVKFKVVILFCL